MNENEMKSLERELRSWQPRRPSATLKHRLFGFSRLFRPAWVFGPLAPAMACALLTLAVYNSGNSSHSPQNGPMLSMVLSNPVYAVCESEKSRKCENDWSAAIFDWTSHASLTSSIAPFSR
ncbi:MAG TPA: hypothetical protein VFV23_08840 [Verrucomicrobiae bacterium]|nr:hypothetical protein [Verrucomicrobiae bacterium]